MKRLTFPEKKDGKNKCNIEIDSSEIKVIEEALNKYIQDHNFDRSDLLTRQMMDIKPQIHKLRGLLNP